MYATHSSRSDGVLIHARQEPPLFGNITIAENIAYGIDATDAQIVAAAREANCDGFISALPLGYATRLGVGRSRRGTRES